MAESDSFWSEIVYRGVESDELDYKAHQSWQELSRAGKGKIVRHLAALANNKGGFVVVGVGENEAGEPRLYTGLTDAESRSFDPTAVGTFVNQCVEPPINFTIERRELDGKRYAIFQVKPFATLPHVCCRTIEGELRAGIMYLRTPEASSRPAYRAIEVQKILQRALRNQREMLGRMLRGILYEQREESGAETNPRAGFLDAGSTAAEFFCHRKKPEFPAVLLQLSVEPESFNAERWPLTELQSAVKTAWHWQPGSTFIADGELNAAYNTNVSWRALPPEGLKMWQIFKSGQFHWISYLPLQDNALAAAELQQLLSHATEFLSALYQDLVRPEELLTISLKLAPVQDCALRFPDHSQCLSRIPQIAVEMRRSTADFKAGWKDHAAHLFRELAERFNAAPEQLKALNVER